MDEIIKTIDEELKKAPETVDLSFFLYSLTNTGSALDPNTSLYFAPWGHAISRLMEKGYPIQALNLCHLFYDRVNEIQVISNIRIPKGLAAHNIGILNNAKGEYRIAKWFFTIAFIEDVISSETSEIPDTPAKHNLKSLYGVSEDYLKLIQRTAKEEKEYVQFPEAILVRLARKNNVTINFGLGNQCIPISKVFLKKMYDMLDDGSTDEKGKLLEFIASYLMLTLPGSRIIPNAKSPDSEMDVIVTLDGQNISYLVESMGRNFLVECKNWIKPVGAHEINHIISKLKFNRCRSGLLIAKNGISGESDSTKRDGELTRLRWFTQDGILLVVFNSETIKQLINEDVDVAQCILYEYEKIRFNIC